jgi:hypothetical protein
MTYINFLLYRFQVACDVKRFWPVYSQEHGKGKSERRFASEDKFPKK